MTGLVMSKDWLRGLDQMATRVEFDGPAWTWPAVCVKRGYPSVHAARQAHRRAGFRVRTYTCETCGQVHVANGEKR